MQYTREQKEMLKKGWAERLNERKDREVAMRAEATAKAKEIAFFLKTQYGLSKIYLFGSLAWRKKFSIHSDIDIYLEDFPEDKCYWEALARSEEIATPYPVSIILAETASPGLRLKVKNEGLLL